MEQRLKRLAAIRVSNVDKKSVQGQAEVRLCNYTDVYYKGLITAELPFMEATASQDHRRKFALQKGDVVVTKDSETPDDIAVPAFVPEILTGVICGYHLAIIRPDPSRIEPKYLFWSLVGESARQQFSASATGVTRFGLRYGDIGNISLFVPSLREQRAIVEFLDRETARIDRIIERLAGSLVRPSSRLDSTEDSVAVRGSFLGLLKEHRQALITAAVAGQIDLSGKAA